MKTIQALLLLALAAAPSAGSVAVVYDAKGFDGLAAGPIAGRQGWRNDDLDPGLPNVQAAIAPAPGGGLALCLPDMERSESSATVGFPDLTGAFRYVMLSFDLFREGDGSANMLWFAATGSPSTGFYGLAQPGSPTARLMPVGYFGGAPSVAAASSAWQNVRLQYDLEGGFATAFVDGALIADDIPVGRDTAFTGWNFTDQSPTASGRKAYIDNVSIVAGQSMLIPEPGTLWLLAGLLPLAALRHRNR